MTSPLQRKLFESHLTTSPSWIDLLHQLPIDLGDYTAFLTSYSDVVLSPPEDQLRIEDLFDDELFEDIKQVGVKEERTVSSTVISNNQQTSHSHSHSSSIFASPSNGGAAQICRSSESVSSNPQGITVHQSLEQLGKPVTQETLRLDETGKMTEQQSASSRRIEDVSEAGNEYSARVDEEHAKRGGA